jgi:hypothetical protein
VRQLAEPIAQSIAFPALPTRARIDLTPEPRRSRRVVSTNALQSLVRLLGDALASEHERARASGISTWFKRP